jgi:Laminin G domain
VTATTRAAHRRMPAARRRAHRRLSSLLVLSLSTPAAVVVLAFSTATPASAAAAVTLTDWEMNEPPGAVIMTDESGNAINGAVGSAVETGTIVDGATAYHWDSTAPNQPPTKPERLVQVNDGRLNPGDRDFAITMRFRTTHSYGNMIQKGQSTTPGGYFKWEIPNGQLMCLFRSRDQFGNLLGQKSVKSPLSMPLNDGRWHTVRCEKTVDRVTMTIDGTVTVQSARGRIGTISNTYPLTIAGKINCDQVKTTCDYFAGDIDFVRIQVSSTGSTDTTPPSAPGQPTGESHGYTTADLSWPAATDDVSTTLRYELARDGQVVASFASSDPVVTHTDTGLVPGSTHTYTVTAFDLAGNASPPSTPSDAITVVAAPQGIFVDDFSSGLSNWTSVSRFALDTTVGNPFAPSAGVQVTSLSATLVKNLPASYPALCVSFDIDPTQLAAGNTLARLTTVGGTGIARVLVDSNGALRMKSDVSGAQSPSGGVLGLGAWHNVETCGTVGTTGTWSLYRDGQLVVNQWAANTGTSSIGRLVIGDPGAKTWTANYDRVVVDQTPGDVF